MNGKTVDRIMALDLPSSQKVILIHLSEARGVAVSASQLATVAGCSRQTAQAHRSALQAAGLLVLESTQGKTPVFRLELDAVAPVV